jgi:hypothetical protein
MRNGRRKNEANVFLVSTGPLWNDPAIAAGACRQKYVND